MLLPRVALGVVLLATAACGVQAQSLSGIEAEAKAVVTADLPPGSTGEDGARLAERYSRMESVAGTRADGGQQLLVFMEPDASDGDVDAVQEALERDPAVEDVTVERRS